MILEGRNAVEGALQGDNTIEKIYIGRDIGRCELINKIKASGTPYQFVDRAVLERLSKAKNHQGFVAVITDFKYHSIQSIIESGYKKGAQPLIVILDGVEDPHNLGNIIRTAECMGADGVVIPKNRAASVNDTAVRVSAGAASLIKICKVTNINQEIEELKAKGFWIYACEAGGLNAAQVNLNGPVALILGGENTGVKHLTRKLSDGIISIPMFGKTGSLNVGSAAAMMLYEVQRQRTKK